MAVQAELLLFQRLLELENESEMSNPHRVEELVEHIATLLGELNDG